MATLLYTGVGRVTCQNEFGTVEINQVEGFYPKICLYIIWGFILSKHSENVSSDFYERSKLKSGSELGKLQLIEKQNPQWDESFI